MVTVKTKYICACDSEKKFNTIAEAMDYVNSTIASLRCFYKSTGGSDDLHQKEVPGSINRVIQLWIPRYTIKTRNDMVMIVLFRIEEGKK